jgi:hypothetical protein
LNLDVRFVERSVGRIPVSRTSARAGNGESPRVVDLSPKGLRALFDTSPEIGAILALEIKHPSLTKPIVVEGEVRWARLGDEREPGIHVGLAFLKVPLATRARLTELIALELGSRVLIGNAPAGYAGAGGDVEGALFLYDGSLKARALIRRDGALYKIERIGDDSELLEPVGSGVASLEAAIRLAFDREGPVKLDPPLAL